MNQKDLQIGHGFVGCNSAHGNACGFEIPGHVFPEGQYFIGETGYTGDSFGLSITTMDGFGWFPGCTLRRLQQGIIQKPDVFSKEIATLLHWTTDIKNY